VNSACRRLPQPASIPLRLPRSSSDQHKTASLYLPDVKARDMPPCVLCRHGLGHLHVQSDEVCAKAEEMLKKNNVPEDQISAVEESLQSSATALTNILLLVGGVAASSVILSLRMKDKLCVCQRQPRDCHRSLSSLSLLSALCSRLSTLDSATTMPMKCAKLLLAAGGCRSLLVLA
jgi:hypothetical protein